jgi:RNA polymerase sigma-70 factor (ECF subfamily)
VLVRSYQGRVFRLACRVLGDAALAEEATAQTFVKVWGRCGQWRGQSAAGTWIYQIALRTILDVQRSQGRWWRRWSTPVTAEVPDPRPGPDEQALWGEESRRCTQRVQDALLQLSENDRALVHLYYFENRSLREIEEILSVSKANLKMRLARAREKLRSMLKGTEDAG